jgi:hypothetical protein
MAAGRQMVRLENKIRLAADFVVSKVWVEIAAD